jgi:hypothetical protein
MSNQMLSESDQMLSEVTLAKECLRYLGEDKSVLHRAAHVLQLVAHSSVGLGEVLQDYAHQAWGQLREVIQASRNAADGTQTLEDLDVLRNVHLVLKSTKTILDMTPAAMQRNKADALGEEKFSRADIAQVAHDFMYSPQVAQVLAAEDFGIRLVALLTGSNAAPTIVLPEQTNILLQPPAVPH